MPQSRELLSGSRRRLLALSAMSFLLPLLPAGCSSDHGNHIGWTELGERLTGLDEETAIRLGHAFGKELPAQRLIGNLPPLDSGNWNRKGLHSESGSLPLGELDEQIRAQYDRMQTETAQGWVLSEIELTVLALAARDAG